MLLSFIVPVYNNSAALAECIASLRPLLDQGEAEAVVVDDGSDEPVADNGKGVQVVRMPHRGAAAARNVGIDVAQGDFLWFVDADDTIGIDGINLMLDELRTMPLETSFFHIGDMVRISGPDGIVPSCCPDVSATRRCVPLQLVRPRSSVSDHTTNIIRRSWLMQHPELRYPEDMSLLEDTVLSLRVVEAAESCLCNDSYRFYLNHAYHPSSTAGAWSAERSARFIGDICRFFIFLKDYACRHGDTAVLQYYKRMRYVYLRVMAVKGCPWNDIKRLMDVVGPVRGIQKPFYRLFAFLCRTLRQKR